jgi:arylsulfatase A-like enzyme
MSQKPNILIFMTDQQRGSSITDERCLTPNLDRFRQRGVTFTNALCPSPHCCPSRATFHTGLYPSEHGVWHNVGVPNAITRGLKDGVRPWSQDLAENGYDLTFSGKWHVSALRSPSDYGWQEGLVTARSGYLEAEEGWRQYAEKPLADLEPKERGDGEILRPGWNRYTHYGLHENPFNDKGVVDSAIQNIRETSNGDRPWCRFIGPQGPHDPYRVPQRFLDMYDLDSIELPENYCDELDGRPNLYKRTRYAFSQLTELEHRKAIMHYLAFCTYEDYLFGQVLQALEEQGELDNTLIVYTSDHGDYTAEHGLWCKGLPCFRGAYHIPMVIGGAGVLDPGRTVDEFISLADFAPTFLELAGIDSGREFAGQSIVPFLRNEPVTDWRDAHFTQSNGNEQYGIQRSIVTQDWKYVYNGFDYDELYDLKNDPLEMHNVIDELGHKETVKELCSRMWTFARERNDSCTNGYIMVGFAPYGPQAAFAPDNH